MTRSRDVSKGATRQEFVYTATSQQTTFSGNDDSSNSLSYTAGQIDVFVNGVRQSAADYTATNGTSVVLGAGASVGDTVQINAFGTFSVADVIVDRLEFDYTATAGQTTFTGSDNDSQTMAYTAGRIDVYLNGSRLNVTDDYVATNGTSVVLQSGAQAGDSLVVVSHGTVNLAANIVAGDLDLNGNELILDVDGDTSITSDTDDQIDFKIANTDHIKFLSSSGDTVIQPMTDTKDIIFKQFDGTGVLAINDGAYAEFLGAGIVPEATLTDASTITWNGLTQSVAKVTLTDNRTLGLASGGVSGAFISILIIQDGSGSRTLSFNAAYEFTGDTAPTLTTTANKGDLFVFRYNGAKWLEVGRNLNLTLS